MVKQGAVAALYAVLAKVVLLYFSTNGIVSLIWPSSGLALALVLIGGRRYLWAVALGAVTVDLWIGVPAMAAVSMAVGDALGAFVGAWCLTRPGSFDPVLKTEKDYLRLILLAAGLSALVAAIVGSTVLMLIGVIPDTGYLLTLKRWWMGDLLGIVVVTPFILVWQRLPSWWSEPRRILELLLILSLSSIACFIIFLGWLNDVFGHYANGFMMFMFVTLTAIRLGKHGVSLIVVMTTGFALVGIARGSNYFTYDLSQADMTGFWFFMVTLSVVGSSMAAYIEEQEQTFLALRKKEEGFRFILETSPIAVRIATSEGRKVLFANSRYSKLINSGVDRTVGADPKRYYARPKDYEDILFQLRQGERVSDKLVELSIPGGGTTWAMASYLLMDFENESAVLGWFYDITGLRDAQEALKASEKKANDALGELKHQKFALDKHAIVAVTDVAGRITYANGKFCEISGYSQDELIGQDHAILNSGHHPKGFFKEMYRTIATGSIWHDEVCNRAKDGHLYWVDTTVAPFFGEDGKPISYISIRTDISKRKAAEERSNYLAFYDELTELPNRRLLLDRLRQAIVSSQRKEIEGALLLIDLDNFKTLNDTLGHDIGDLLLKQVAQRLSRCLREGDTVARLGGDEFVVMLQNLSSDTNEALFQTESIAKKVLVALTTSFILGTHDYRITSSIGATLFVGSKISSDEVMKRADIAMYQAKKAGRNSIRFFDPDMQSAVETRSALERALAVAIAERQLILFFQMQVNHMGNILGAEVLLRWRHADLGMVSPAHFIPVAEETGLIVPIGQWVLETACEQLKAWESDPDKQHLQLAVNVSARQFRQPDFVDLVRSALTKTQANPALLKLELTESLVLDNVAETIDKMLQLKDVGVKFSMDDFGTGYSSLSSLKKLPLDQLKIDQSFVRDITTDRDDAIIVQTIIAMAKNLGMEVIAEGVETEAQRDFLIEQNCHNFQGYLFGRPVPQEEFNAMRMKG